MSSSFDDPPYKRFRTAGANVNVTDRWGGTPLEDAIQNGHQAVAEFLIKHG